MDQTNIHIPGLGGSNAFTRTLSKNDVKICVAVEEAFTVPERCSEEKVSPSLNVAVCPGSVLLTRSPSSIIDWEHAQSYAWVCLLRTIRIQPRPRSLDMLSQSVLPIRVSRMGQWICRRIGDLCPMMSLYLLMMSWLGITRMARALQFTPLLFPRTTKVRRLGGLLCGRTLSILRGGALERAGSCLLHMTIW